MVETAHRFRVITVVGTRPEIIKCSPVIPLFDEHFEQILIHTGQHYDDVMDGSFFRDLRLRDPDYDLDVRSGSHGTQLARMILGIEPVLQEHEPDWVFVQGDTNSTLAGALAAAKLNVPVAHLEAGCRSFNRAMPEEMNRILVDHVSELCLAPDEIAEANLVNEGIPPGRIERVGSTGIDACLRAGQIPNEAGLLVRAGVESGEFLVATIHRAENTTPERLRGLLGALHDLSARWPVIFPVHPRTAKVLASMERPESIHYTDPVGYPRMMGLLQRCRALLTDSGGLQEEAAVLGVPTFILRSETEWMAFVTAGHHRLVGTDRAAIVNDVLLSLDGGIQERRMREPVGRERAGAAQRVVGAMLARSANEVEVGA